MDNKMIEYLLSVATYVDNYCKYLKKNTNDYASILGYLYRVHQDEIRNISPQGITDISRT